MGTSEKKTKIDRLHGTAINDWETKQEYGLILEQYVKADIEFMNELDNQCRYYYEKLQAEKKRT